jgi:tetratricopeptide (TPR) repeat protein
MKYAWLVPTALLTAAAATWNCSRTDASATTAQVETDPCAIALAPSEPRDDADRDIARLQQRARSGSEGARALEQLGFRYVALARTRHDDGAYLLAEKAAECLALAEPEDATALLIRGHAMHQQHRFAEAENVARTLVAKRGMPLDYGLLGDALMEQGRLAAAGDAYQKMIDLKPFYQSYTRAAHLRWLKGDLDGAIESIRMAIAAASPRDPESIAWAYTRLAQYELQHGRLREAARALDAALEHQPDYAAALLARGRLLLATAKDGEAVEVLRRAARLNPLPEYEWALADALRRSRSAAEAENVERRLTRDGARSDPRTVALFLATRRASVPQAVALAQRELTARSDVFTLDAVAWTLAAAGRIDEAESLMKRAVAEGTQDGRLFLHAGAIAAAVGRRGEARTWLKKAERVRAMLLPSELDELATLQTRIFATEEN